MCISHINANAQLLKQILASGFQQRLGNDAQWEVGAGEAGDQTDGRTIT